MNEIKINLDYATENQIFWLKELLKEEIEEARVAANNEHLWALGSEDEESERQHEENAEENRDYATMLEGMLKQLGDIWNYD